MESVKDNWVMGWDPCGWDYKRVPENSLGLSTPDLRAPER